MAHSKNDSTDETETKALVEAHVTRNSHLRVKFENRQVNLAEPRPVDFHFFASTQRDAAVLGRSLYNMGFLVKLITPLTDAGVERWSIEAGAKIPLDDALGEELMLRLVNTAAKEDSIFDGWATSV